MVAKQTGAAAKHAGDKALRHADRHPRIALTCGEPAGVGPELCLAISSQTWNGELVCLGDRDLLAKRARQIGSLVELVAYDLTVNTSAHRSGVLTVEHHPLAAPSIPGKPDTRNAQQVIELLDRAIEGCLSGEFDAVVTAPVQKSIINVAGIPFTGHTEYFAQQLGVSRPVMMLATETLRVALATTHLPLKEVSSALELSGLCETIEILDRDLKRLWKLSAPRIAVCGLNPHAGEGGFLGDEEVRVIAPAIALMRERGISVFGPIPADTAFVPKALDACDAVLAMYHDQGLPVIKHTGFDSAVNVTLGLPIVRTSVDHGTALDLAGTGRADAGSLTAALRLALQMVTRHTPPEAKHVSSLAVKGDTVSPAAVSTTAIK